MAVSGACGALACGLDTSEDASDEDVAVLSRALLLLPLLLLCMLLLLFVLTCELELTVRLLLAGITVDGGVAYISLLVFDMRLCTLSLA